MSSEKVVLYAEFTALPGSADQVSALITKYAEIVRSEPGDETFEVYRMAENPDCFVVFEMYSDRAAFDDHIGADAGREFNAQLTPNIFEPESVLSFLTPVGPT